jgi:hypothetical protein
MDDKLHMDDQLKKEVQKKYGLSEEDTRIAHLEENLHSREKEGFIPWRHRKDLEDVHDTVAHDFQHNNSLEFHQVKPKNSPLPTIAFVISMLMLVVAGGFAFLAFSDQSHTVDPVTKLSVSGPHAVRSGDTVELQVVATNDGDYPLELAELVVTLPEGAHNPEAPKEAQKIERIPLGQIAAHATRRGTVRSIFFGKTHEVKHVDISLEYRVQGGSVIYVASDSLDVTITSESLAVEVDAKQESAAGQKVDVDITVTSQATSVMYGAVASIRYPFGFTALETEPAVTGDEPIWDLGDLLPGESRKIHIRGKFAGAEGDERAFVVTGGLRTTQDKKIDVPLVSYSQVMTIKQPFLAMSLTLDGESPETFSFKAGQEVKALVRWKNTLNYPIENAAITLTLGGDGLDKKAIKVVRGFYRSLDSVIIWDKQTKKDTFTVIPPNGSGVEEFSIKTLSEDTIQDLADPVITFSLHGSGKRTAETSVPEVLEAVASHSVPIQTKAGFIAEAKYFTSPFPKSGPLPPRVDYETIYAVEWKLNNTSSDLTDSEVTAQLPANIRYLSVRTPISENITFNEATRTVTWFPGRIPKGTGVGDAPPKSVTFAIGLVPSASQIGTDPDIVINQKFTATDTFSKEQVSIVTDDLNTILTEEGFNERYSIVAE